MPTTILRALLASAVLAVGVAGCAGPERTRSSAAATPALSSAQIAQIVASPDRSEADRRNDVRRKPADMLAFIGVRPGMTALDLSAGGGYTTELLARAVGPTGRVFGQSSTPDGAPGRSALALAERAKKPSTANITAVVQPFEAPVPAALAANGLDLVTLMFNYHDLSAMGVDRARMNAAVFAALKPGGVYVVADHSGRPGTGISEGSTLHRIEEAFVRREVEAAGFRLLASADFLRNPNDPRDKETPDPPQPKDEFVLKFVKP
jgi:predicted methyltransferase